MLPSESNDSTSDEIIFPGGGGGGICTRDPRLSSSQEKAGNTYGMSCNPGRCLSQLLEAGELQDGGLRGGGMTNPMSIRRSSSDSCCLRIVTDFGSGICLDLGSWNNARASRNAGCHASMCLNWNIWCH